MSVEVQMRPLRPPEEVPNDWVAELEVALGQPHDELLIACDLSSRESAKQDA
ncbi:MAG TPA: hypothetical protein VIN58_14555 [Roseateles sp.]